VPALSQNTGIPCCGNRALLFGQRPATGPQVKEEEGKVVC